jgi:hypothetical protein
VAQLLLISAIVASSAVPAKRIAATLRAGQRGDGDAGIGLRAASRG